MRSHPTMVLLAAVLVAGCTLGGAESPPDEASGSADTEAADPRSPTPPEDDRDAPADGTEGEPDPAPTPPPDCRVDAVEVDALELTGPASVEVAAQAAERTHRCAPVAVVAADDPWAAIRDA
ncbi:MAG: hypothetical protein ACLFV0_04880, partial [Nitriliruptoraceae bacterium]